MYTTLGLAKKSPCVQTRRITINNVRDNIHRIAGIFIYGLASVFNLLLETRI